MTCVYATQSASLTHNTAQQLVQQECALPADPSPKLCFENTLSIAS